MFIKKNLSQDNVTSSTLLELWESLDSICQAIKKPCSYGLSKQRKIQAPLNLNMVKMYISSLSFVQCREFSKRMDSDLHFYYWTLNKRYRDEELPSFNECPEISEDQDLSTHPLQLHRLRINQREDSSLFISAQAYLSARHKRSLRQAYHKPEDILRPLPPPPLWPKSRPVKHHI